MSDDLISRKSLIENLNEFAPEHYTALVNDLIMKEPTAFDKEKVLSVLYHYLAFYEGELDYSRASFLEKIIDAIEEA